MTELPMLPDVEFNEKVEPTRENMSAYDLAYEQFKFDQTNQKEHITDMGVPIITLEMLEIAPKDFFKKFEQLTKETASAIIASISASKQSITIAKHKSDPTNVELKRDIVQIVAYQFNVYEKKNDAVTALSAVDKDILLALVTNEVIGLGPLEPLWNDKRITEIMVNGPHDIQVEIKGIVRTVPSVRFRDKAHLMALIEKLYSSINKQLSPTNPSERGRLHDNSRMYAVHEIIAPDGPNFNIRKHNEKYWTPLDIVSQGTASPELMHYIGNLIHSGVSFAIAGGTGTGKTTLMNALTGFIPNNARVITLEENLEMKPHPKKLIAAPMECVPAKPGEGKEFGVTMRDLVRSSLQMRPEYIIIGEVSDGAAYDLCQALNTGHSGGSTVHANDAKDSINRLRSLVSQEDFVRGPAVLDLIGSAFDIIIVVDRLLDGSRKISEVVEVGRDPIRGENGELTLETHTLWEMVTDEDVDENGNTIIIADWIQTGELSEYRQRKHRLMLNKELSWDELLEISTWNVPVEQREGGI